MSFMFGGSKSKSTSTSNSSFNNTTTPIVPEWARSLTESAAGRVGDLNKADPYSFGAPSHALQTQAATQAGALTGMAPAYEQGANLVMGAGGSPANTYKPGTLTGAELGGYTQAASHSLLDNLDAYMSPYRRQVVAAALADFDSAPGRRGRNKTSSLLAAARSAGRVRR